MYLLCINCVDLCRITTCITCVVFKKYSQFCFSVHFLPVLVQSETADDKVERSADGDEDGNQEAQKEQEVDKLEEGQGGFSSKYQHCFRGGVLLNS